MTETVYVVVNTPDGEYFKVSIASSFEDGDQSRDAVEEISAAGLRKVVAYTPGSTFDKLHITVCGHAYTVQVLLDLMVRGSRFRVCENK
jgi:hypothetical protein